MKTIEAVESVLRRDGTVSSYDRARIVSAILKATIATGEPDMKLAELIARKTGQMLSATYGSKGTPSVEDIQDIVENTLMESGHPAVARNYIIYRHQRAQLRQARSQPFEMSDIIPYRKIYEVLLWNLNHRCDSVPALNALIAAGHFPKLVRECEQRYKEEVDAAASQILARADKIRVIIVAGPSASGKTTTMIKISERLQDLSLIHI